MTEMLKQADKRVVGSKQVLRALNEDKAARVFLGRDADGFIYHRINGLCEEKLSAKQTDEVAPRQAPHSPHTPPTWPIWSNSSHNVKLPSNPYIFSIFTKNFL